MYCAKTFRANGFKVAQSVYYSDPETNQARETDLVCYYQKTIEDVTFNLTFVLECKKSSDKPWIVFKSNNKTKRLRGFDVVEGTLNGIALLNDIDQHKGKRRKSTIEFLAFEDIAIGHGATQAFTSGPDTTYSAITTVLKAIRYFVEKYSKTKVKICSLYFPVIVIDSKLFDVALLENNEIQIQEVTQSKLLQIRSDLNKTTIIQITTKSNVEEYCRRLKAQCEKFFKVYDTEIQQIAVSRPYSNKLNNWVF